MPCYNEEAVLGEMHAQLHAILHNLIANGKAACNSCILYVNDGSKDANRTIIE